MTRNGRGKNAPDCIIKSPMNTRFILGCVVLGLGISAFGQTSSKDLPEAPSSTIAPPKTQQAAPPAQPAQAPQEPATSNQQPTFTDLTSKEKAAPAQAPTSAEPQQSDQQKTKPPAQSEADQSQAEKSDTIVVKNVNEVNVVFTVTDKHGRFVKDLKKDDIKVLDDNKPQDIVSFRSETDLPLRVGLLIDASNSIRDRFKFEQEAAIEFLNQIVRPKSDKAFVIGFDSVAEVTQDYTDKTDALAHGVRMLKAGGGTALFDAVYFACREKLQNPPPNSPNGPSGARRAMILLSDGEDNQSRVTREEAVEMAQRAEVIIYVISTNITGIKTRGDKVLERFAETTGGRLFTPFKLQDVADAFTEIQDELRSQYAISYHPADLVKDGRYRTIAIDAPAKKNLRVRARKGYYAPKPETATSQNKEGAEAISKN
jgi:Ca-activated chloride channel family protein